jgi:16S rRNA processing protein RimM
VTDAGTPGAPASGAPAPDEAPDDLALVGLVRRAHGIRGELAVETFTDAPAEVFSAGRRVFVGTPEGRLLPADPKRPVAAGGPAQTLTVERASPFKGGLIVRFAEVADRTGAERWRERGLLVPYAELPPPGADEVYLHELVGMRVVHRDGTAAGEVVDLLELPQGLALDVRVAGTARTALVPYRPEMVVGVDVPARTVTVDLPEGLLD